MKNLQKILLGILFMNISYGQNDFDAQIQNLTKQLTSKLTVSSGQKIAVNTFAMTDNSINQLGVFLSDEISSELANTSSNNSQFQIIERANLEQIIKEKKILDSFDAHKLAKELGKIKAADILIFGIITKFDGFYRINIRILDTKEGNLINSVKGQFVKSSSLDELANKNISGETIVKNSDNSSQDSTQTIPCNNDKGDYCFENTTSYTVTFWIDEDNGYGIQYLTLSPYEKGCLYDLKSGVHKARYIFMNQNHPNYVGTHQYTQFRVEKCGKGDKTHKVSVAR